MNLIDYLGYAGMAIIFILSCIAILRLWKIITMARVGSQPALKDPEPAPLRYSDFEEATDLPVCCKAVRALAARGGTSIEYGFTAKDDIVRRVEVKVMFCPGCGRKLK